MTSKTSPLTSSQVNQSVTTTTSIIRTLRLKSTDAYQNKSPTEKSWILPPVLTEMGTRYKLLLRSLHLFHVFGNFTLLNNTLQVKNTSGNLQTITIAPGDYDADSLVDYLYDTLKNDCSVEMSYDPIQCHFHWTPALKVGAATTCMKQLGLPGANDTTGYTESPLVMNLSGVSRIDVDTNLTLNTLPMSGRLAMIPVSTNFGGMIDYHDKYAAQPLMCLDQTLQVITIRLLDQDGVALSDYLPITDTSPYWNVYVPPWEVTISFESYGDPGYINTLPALVNGAIADVSQLPTPGETFVRQEGTGTVHTTVAPISSAGDPTLHRSS